MLVGPNPPDAAFAEALRRSAVKFGLEIGAEKGWSFETDMRRSAVAEVPPLTQDLGDHDVLLVADEVGDFGQYVLYNTWEARPVAGSEGLAPANLVGRARAMGRRAAAEPLPRSTPAATCAPRTTPPGRRCARSARRSPAPAPPTRATLRAYMLSDEFRLDGFKGAILSFRPWNGQLRQPIPLVHPRALVALAPMEGFLHQASQLDTLGPRRARKRMHRLRMRDEPP